MRKVIPLFFLSLILFSCSAKYSNIYLAVKSEQTPGKIVTLQVSMKPVSGDSFKVLKQSYSVSDFDIVNNEYIIKIVIDNQNSPLVGLDLLSIVGLDSDGRVQASFYGEVDVSGPKKKIAILLERLGEQCDEDGDGFKNCSVSGCCSETEKESFSDCDDSNENLNPFSENPYCQSCVDTDSDGVLDCEEIVGCNLTDASKEEIEKVINDKNVYPGAKELCDGVDNDCDGETDEGFIYINYDGKIMTKGEKGCGAGVCKGGKVVCSNDGSKLVCSTDNKATKEIKDGLDNNCNGLVDEGVIPEVDTDGDGYSDEFEESKCKNKYAVIFADIYPDAPEGCCPEKMYNDEKLKYLCDKNCDGKIPEKCGKDDSDGDGFVKGEDCDDSNPQIYPGAPEKCGNQVDEDCDGVDLPCAEITDDDGDGYSASVDCDDNDKTVHPGAEELCNGIDDNCNGIIDEGNPEAGIKKCGDYDLGECKKGLLACDHSKDFQNPEVVCYGAVNPTDEVCDGLDNDCDGKTDNNLTLEDSPCKQVGVCEKGVVAKCENGEWKCDYSGVGGYEESETLCDNLDNDCDGETDEALVDPSYSDCKKVGLCSSYIDKIKFKCVGGIWICDYSEVPGYSNDDFSCDNVDNDCDGETDEDVFYKNPDGSKAKKGEQCVGIGECGKNENGEILYGTVECNGNNEVTCSTNPDGSEPQDSLEICDGEDNDCDGLTDEELTIEDSNCKLTGVCNKENVLAVCQNGTWLCSYENVENYEGDKEESCDYLDNDCDGKTDEGLFYIDPNDPSKQSGVGENCVGIGECGKDENGETFYGKVECNDLGMVTCSTNPDGSQSKATDEICDYKDNDCDGETDEDFDYEGKKIDEGCDGIGECGEGKVECLPDGSGATCSTNADGSNSQATKEVCDGKDNDCDGLTDEDLTVEDSTCLNEGVCKGNVIAVCTNGVWICSYENVPNYEPGEEKSCDGLDNDCDGETDEDFKYNGKKIGLACKGIGECGFGKVVCSKDGKSATCSTNPDGTESEAEEEICDYKDNDCDGEVDEDFSYKNPDGTYSKIQETCDGVGECGEGVVECSADHKKAVCSTNPDGTNSEAEKEVCDGKDNDCDGATDEDLTIDDSPCKVKGVCNKNNVLAYCINGSWNCDYSNVPDYTGINETLCDGKDNDCDGLTDEDFKYNGIGIGGVCDGIGMCGVGTVECTADKKKVTCSTNPDGSQPGNSDEVCDGKDNDCDGEVDEDLSIISEDCTCKVVGVCTIKNVSATCKNGAWQCDYSNVPYYDGDKETHCDGLDNDCDGQIDEDFTYIENGEIKHKGDSCGTGACQGGTVICKDDQSGLICSTDLSSGEEVCDGKDNDCDGETDEGLTYHDPVTGDDLALGAECHGIGECGIGIVECGSNLKATCSTNPDGSESQAKEEICDGKDNNCNGETDEGLNWNGIPLGNVCDGTGECGMGTVVCNSNFEATCSTNPDGPDSEAGEETCNGKDDDCDGKTDEDLDVTDSTCKLIGVCNETNVNATCSNGKWFCDYSMVENYTGNQETLCDGLDNDCDGETDEDFTLTLKDGTVVSGINVDCGTGLCSGGKTKCKADKKGIFCPTELNATDEDCNGIDDDCDGKTDEASDLSNNTPYCEYQKGVCAGSKKDTSLCSGGEWQECTSTIYDNWAMTTEGVHYNEDVETLCDGYDNDCDGETDEDFTITLLDGTNVSGVGTKCGTGICSNGLTVCKSDKSGIYCPTEQNATDEQCNGLDDDCDGKTDTEDDDMVLQLCENQKGVCKGATHTKDQCKNGTWEECTDTEYLNNSSDYEGDYEKTCDNKDNDCDGKTDDDFMMTTLSGEIIMGAGKPCGVGACEGGQTICNGSHDGIVCSTEQTNVSSEVCDGIDNDCDGNLDAADSDLVLTLCEKQDGVCSGAKHTKDQCVSGKWESCTSSNYGDSYQAVETWCDNLDNDCDGKTDEGCDEDGDGYCTDSRTVYFAKDADGNYTTPPSVCKNTTNPDPTKESANGDDCNDTDKNINPDADEVCDGMDNDCDSKTDADDSDLVLEVCEDQDGVCSGAKHSAEQCVSGKWQTCTSTEYSANSSNYETSENTCDNLDNDCDSITDENCDDDNDKYCDENMDVVYDASGKSKATVCPNSTGQPNTTEPGDDCDDDLATGGDVYPDASEICDGKDNDCDGDTDAKDDDLVLALCEKQKGVCNGATHTKDQCVSGKWQKCTDSEYTTNNSSYESTEKTCDGLDNDCNGQTDEGCDDDDDGYCDKNMFCVSGHLNCESGACTDCNDDDDLIFPGATEYCDNKDNDCDNTTDEECDGDGDKYCSSAKTVYFTKDVSGNYNVPPSVCPNTTNPDPTKETAQGDDCDDTNKNINPGVTSDTCSFVTSGDDDCDEKFNENDPNDAYDSTSSNDTIGDATALLTMSDSSTSWQTVTQSSGKIINQEDFDWFKMGITDDGKPGFSLYMRLSQIDSSTNYKVCIYYLFAKNDKDLSCIHGSNSETTLDEKTLKGCCGDTATTGSSGEHVSFNVSGCTNTSDCAGVLYMEVSSSSKASLCDDYVIQLKFTQP